MEHIGNYLDKYRHMIAEFDAERDARETINALQVAAIEQGKQIEECKKVCEGALARLSELEKEHERTRN